MVKLLKYIMKQIRKKFNKFSNDSIFKLAINKCINHKKVNKSIELIID